MSINYAYLWCTCSRVVTTVFPPFNFFYVLLFPSVQSSRFLIESLVARLEPCL